MKAVYEKNPLLVGPNKFCPGCGHSLLNKIIAEVLVENGWANKTITALCIGCALNITHYVNWDLVQSPHGRAAAVATGIKHMQKDKLVYSYQGDGDAAGIGLAETFHAASRGEPFTQIMVNNQIYGMTGGQSSCTTLIGQRTTTTGPEGRDPARTGYPTKLAEVIATIAAAGYVARVSLHDPMHVRQTKKVLEKAFRLQLEENKYSFIEILAMCPTNFHVEPWDAPDYMVKHVLPVFPLGELKTPEGR